MIIPLAAISTRRGMKIFSKFDHHQLAGYSSREEIVPHIYAVITFISRTTLLLYSLSVESSLIHMYKTCIENINLIQCVSKVIAQNKFDIFKLTSRLLYSSQRNRLYTIR